MNENVWKELVTDILDGMSDDEDLAYEIYDLMSPAGRARLVAQNVLGYIEDAQHASDAGILESAREQCALLIEALKKM